MPTSSRPKSSRSKTPEFVPSRATKLEEATATEGICVKCGEHTTVHWYVDKMSWWCRKCHPARGTTSMTGTRGLDREVLGDVRPTRYAVEHGDSEERLP